MKILPVQGYFSIHQRIRRSKRFAEFCERKFTPEENESGFYLVGIGTNKHPRQFVVTPKCNVNTYALYRR